MIDKRITTWRILIAQSGFSQNQIFKTDPKFFFTSMRNDNNNNALSKVTMVRTESTEYDQKGQSLLK
jgi:hypothetical protein